MTDKLPPNLLALFTARPPLRWVPPCDAEPSQRKTPAVTAVAPALAQAKEVDEKYKHLEHPPTESWLEKRDRVKLEKEEKLRHLRTEGRNECMFSLLSSLRSAEFVLIRILLQSTPTTTPTSKATP
jgi:hypothetical protein